MPPNIPQIENAIGSSDLIDLIVVDVILDRIAIANRNIELIECPRPKAEGRPEGA